MLNRVADDCRAVIELELFENAPTVGANGCRAEPEIGSNAVERYARAEQTEHLVFPIGQLLVHRPLRIGRDIPQELLRVFFFQAEDGIRDYKVTGVQTCALPI